MASRDQDPHGIQGCKRRSPNLASSPPDVDAGSWWREWLQIKFETSITYYQLGRVREMMEVANEIKPLIDQYGSAHQQAELANQMLLIDRRLHRFAATEASLKYSGAFVAVAQRSQDLPLKRPPERRARWS